MFSPNYLARLVSAIYRHQMACMNRMLAPHRLGGGSYVFLLKIKENPGISQNELSRDLLIDKATTSKMIARLEQQEMVRRTRSLSDRRAVILELTEQGEQTYSRLMDVAAKYRELMLDGISAEEQEQAIWVLQRILSNLYGMSDEESPSDFFGKGETLR